MLQPRYVLKSFLRNFGWRKNKENGISATAHSPTLGSTTDHLTLMMQTVCMETQGLKATLAPWMWACVLLVEVDHSIWMSTLFQIVAAGYSHHPCTFTNPTTSPKCLSYTRSSLSLTSSNTPTMHIRESNTRRLLAVWNGINLWHNWRSTSAWNPALALMKWVYIVPQGSPTVSV